MNDEQRDRQMWKQFLRDGRGRPDQIELGGGLKPIRFGDSEGTPARHLVNIRCDACWTVIATYQQDGRMLDRASGRRTPFPGPGRAAWEISECVEHGELVFDLEEFIRKVAKATEGDTPEDLRAKPAKR